MASTRPHLRPEPIAPAPAAQPEGGAHVHVAPAEQGWVMRVGRRIEAHFESPEQALDVAVPLARKRSARVFLHLASGERREMSTAPAEDLLYEVWKDIHARGMLHTDG